VILVFYSADWSPVCGDELALFNDVLPEPTGTVSRAYPAHHAGDGLSERALFLIRIVLAGVPQEPHPVSGYRRRAGCARKGLLQQVTV
jgi:alkyl hydroperoxide reductase subunit AhpC